MSSLQSIAQVDLAPPANKTYFNTDREWREEFIYFLLVDRFHDSTVRHPNPGTARSAGIAVPGIPFYGGTIKGITANLDYIAGLGCTAIWLSPVFENTDDGYHGYHIRNYLNIDPRFGTLQDLQALTQAAHSYQKNGAPWPIRIILDVVVNHSGDNWFYQFEDLPGTQPYQYYNDTRFKFGGWRSSNYPVPVELRNEDYYHMMGNMRNYDMAPENKHGDMDGLKDYNNEDTKDGSALINILIKAHCYWIKEADIDGFRVDAVKHFNPLACSIFCSAVREYAYSLGKKNFFLFGELANTDSSLYSRYIGANTSVVDNGDTVYFGINSLLDFRLAMGIGGDGSQGPLRGVMTGTSDPSSLFKRLQDQQNQALNRGELGRYLVSFVDNHDSFWQPGRIGSLANDDQVIASVGFLLCTLGTACIYYGTEQGFSGVCNYSNDSAIREAMFDANAPGRNYLNTSCTIYKAISVIAEVMRSHQPLRFGRLYYREISGDKQQFGLPYGSTYTLAFSRILYGSEVLVAYNVSGQARQDYVIVDSSYHQPGDTLTYLYGGVGTVAVQGNGKGAVFVQLPLRGHQFVILA
jgi:alpha-amylase